MKAIMISGKPKWSAKIANGDKTIEVRTSKALASAIQNLIDEYGHADIYWYCTLGSPYLAKPKDYDKYLLFTKGAVDYTHEQTLNGKVLFKFRCYKVEEIKPLKHKPSLSCPYDWLYYIVNDSPNNLKEKSCLSFNELHTYLQGENGYAIHISDLEIFDKPKELSEFYGCCDNYTKNVNIFKNINDRYIAQYFNNPKCLKCKHYDGDNWCSKIEEPLTRAPQSWCYVEVEE